MLGSLAHAVAAARDGPQGRMTAFNGVLQGSPSAPLGQPPRIEGGLFFDDDRDVLSWIDSDDLDGTPAPSMIPLPTTPGTVRLEGPATLAEAPEIRRRLAAALVEGGGGKRVAIDLGGSGPWDLAGLQLLLSVVAGGRRDGVTIRFGAVPGVCRDLAGRAGLGPWLDSLSDSSA